MDKHTRQRDIQVSVMKYILNKLLIIASIGLAAAGVIFLVISFTGKFDGTWPLAASLACIVLSNIFNIIRIRQGK